MKRFIVLLILFAAGCMTANDQSSTCTDKTNTVTVRDTVAIHDTVRVVKNTKDTLRLHDTVTVIKKETVLVHDTLLATFQNPESIYGVWGGSSGGKTITIAFSSDDIHPAQFTANIGTVATKGYFSQIDPGQATLTWDAYKDVTWLMELKDGVLIIQEIGIQMFPGGAVTLRKR